MIVRETESNLPLGWKDSTSLLVSEQSHPPAQRLYLIYGYREIDKPHRWYVGSCQYIRERIRDSQHRSELGDGKKFHRELKKIANGRCFDELVIKVVLEVLWGTPQDAIDRENLHMDRLDSIKNGFNSRHAGWTGLSNKGKKLSKEHKQKISDAQKGKKHTKESRRKMSKSKKGKPNPVLSKSMKGKPNGQLGLKRSKETRRKMSEWQIGRKLSKEHRMKLSKAKKGKPWTAARRAAGNNRNKKLK